MTLLITRDVRTGGAYDHTTDAAIGDRKYPHEAADIEVEIGGIEIEHGTRGNARSGDPADRRDEPGGATVEDQARVVRNVARCDPATSEDLPELLFQAGQIIDLTESEIEEAREQAYQEAMDATEPEYA